MKKIVAFVICMLFVGNSNAELVVKDTDTVVGDYLQFESMGTTWPDSLGEYMDMENYVHVEDYQDSGMRLEVTGEGQVEFDGEMTDYQINTMSWDSEFTLVFEEGSQDSDDDKYKIRYEVLTNQWVSSNGTVIKDIDNTEMIMSILIDGEESVWESVSELEMTTINVQGLRPAEIRVGDAWTISETYTIEGVEKERIDGGEWEYDNIDEEVTTTTHYEALREMSITTSAGTFETLEIKIIDDNDDAGTYEMDYLDSNMMIIKMQIYTDDKIEMTMQLKEYRYSVTEEESRSDIEIPGLSLILSISSIILIAIVRRNK